MARWGTPGGAAAAGAALLVAVGCGGGGHSTSSVGASSPLRTEPAPVPPPVRRRPDPLALPRGVPQAGTQTADAAAQRVIRAWLARLRRGDVTGAADLLADGSRVQNGTPVLVLATRHARRDWVASFPCGARAVGFAARRGYTIVDFLLTERAGGDCMGAAGRTARGAIRVRGGRIVGWYRLPDEPPAPGGIQS
jgi:hypothetical protein